ncbi:MAG: hypothetical protein ACRC5M_05630 [Anaeroplasmataceae bacterium]
MSSKNIKAMCDYITKEYEVNLKRVKKLSYDYETSFKQYNIYIKVIKLKPNSSILIENNNYYTINNKLQNKKIIRKLENVFCEIENNDKNLKFVILLNSSIVNLLYTNDIFEYVIPTQKVNDLYILNLDDLLSDVIDLSSIGV